jgi:DNA polymerase
MNKREMLNLLNEKICHCSKCPELVANRTQTVLDSGNPESRILFIGEAPGQNEDEQGEVFVGKAGQLLTNVIASLGLDRKNDTYIINPIKCRPPDNRKPSKIELENCAPFFKLQIKIANPKFIVCMGAVAAKALLDMEESVGMMRGRWFKYEDGIVNADVLVTYHPSYLLRNPNAKKDVAADMQLLMDSMALLVVRLPSVLAP